MGVLGELAGDLRGHCSGWWEIGVHVTAPKAQVTGHVFSGKNLLAESRLNCVLYGAGLI